MDARDSTGTTAGRRGVALTPMETRRSVMVRTARLADELGYEVFALPEGWGLDSTAVLAEIALATERIRLASGVLSVWGRTPGTLAMAAATLHEISGGRYLLGLGASTEALTEGFHDVPFAHPADRLGHTATPARPPPPRRPAGAHGARRPRPARRRARHPARQPARAPAPPRPGACPDRADLGRGPGSPHDPGRRRTGRRVVPRAGRARPPPRRRGPAGPTRRGRGA